MVQTDISIHTCRNSNSLGVELCSYKNSNGSFAFKPKTVDNAVWLVKELMTKYNVPIANVLRHYDVTGKFCPEPYVRNGKLWNDFKHRLTEKENKMVTNAKIIINGKNYTVSRIFKNNKNYICLKDFEKAGFKVDYDSENKIPILSNKSKLIELVVDGKITSVETVNINGNNFVSIRSISKATGKFDVGYEDGRIVIKTK